MSDRPFKVLGIQQIAVGGLDKQRLRNLWVDTLGLQLSGNFPRRLRAAPLSLGIYPRNVMTEILVERFK